MTADLRCGDALEVLRELESESFHGMLTDPPYGLKFMGKRWDAEVPAAEVWREALRVLKPGAHALVACGTRTQHRMATNLEDAGFEIRDVVAWIYGSGFPKSHNLSGEHHGYGTALKPAMELWTLARKPLIGTVAENVLAHGVGALNIDECRVTVGLGEVVVDDGQRTLTPSHEGYQRPGRSMFTHKPVQRGGPSNTSGRWPANVIHDGGEEVLAAFPDAPGQQQPDRGDQRSQGLVYGRMTTGGDTGSTARFFYCAKASREEREAGLQGFPRQQVGMVSETSGQHITRRDGGYERPVVANHHPTVKPIALTEYLARLVLPPGVGRLLVPFSGVGSEVIGGLRAGWTEVVGIELEAEYVEIARARVAFWAHRELTFDGEELAQQPLFAGEAVA